MPTLTAFTSASLSPRGSRTRGPATRAVTSASPAPEPQAEPQIAATKEPSSASAAAPKKLRRSRVPGNLAQMYGESASKRDLEPAPAEPEKKARRDAQSRARRKAAMQVDEGVLQRLSRSQSGPAALVVGEDEAPARRGRTWQASCGKCGTRSTFRTAGALCPTCGTIFLREFSS